MLYNIAKHNLPTASITNSYIQFTNLDNIIFNLSGSIDTVIVILNYGITPHLQTNNFKLVTEYFLNTSVNAKHVGYNSRSKEEAVEIPEHNLQQMMTLV